jgi:hypothetical protein
MDYDVIPNPMEGTENSIPPNPMDNDNYSLSSHQS